MNTRTQTLPLWAPLEDWAPTDLEILEVTMVPRRRRERRLPLNAYAGKSRNKSRKKVRAPGFEP
jgi:hypothetical protein